MLFNLKRNSSFLSQWSYKAWEGGEPGHYYFHKGHDQNLIFFGHCNVLFLILTKCALLSRKKIILRLRRIKHTMLFSV